MVRKGRDLEMLVAHLEDHLGPLGIHVESPDFIPDKDTSQMREVDISLRSRIGSSNILVILECRDRKGEEDVTWIEQLSKKRESVGADKAVAVSSSGFSGPATIKAMKENIELRTLGEVDPDEIGKWFQDREGTHLMTNVLFKDLSFILSDGTKIEGKGIDLDLPIFKKKKDGEEISLRNFWTDIPKPIFYASVPENGTHVERKIEINYILEGETIPENAIEDLENLQLITSNGIIDLKQIYIHAELWLDARKVPIKAKHYKKSDGTIAEVIEFEYEEKGKKHAIEIISDPLSDKKRICLVPKGHNDPEKIDIAFTATKNSLKNTETKCQDYYLRLGQKNSSLHQTKAAHPARELAAGAPEAQSRVDAGAMQAGADLIMAVEASAENASVVEAEVEPLKVEPVAAVGGQEAIVAKPEGRKMGRPKKTASEGKTERKTEAKPTAKRQKSRFDF